MARKIRSTKRADRRFEEIKEYLTTEFGENTTERFVKRLFSFYDIVTDFPKIGTLVNKEKGIYGFVLEKPVSVSTGVIIRKLSFLIFLITGPGLERKNIKVLVVCLVCWLFNFIK